MDKLRHYEVSCINEGTSEPIYTKYPVTAQDSVRARIKADQANAELIEQINKPDLRRRWIISPVEA